MKNLAKQLQNTCHQYNLLKRGSKIVIGVSGGPDSVCLLDIFSKLQKTYSLNIIIAHVNYRLRGKDSIEDEEFVRAMADKYGLKIEVLQAEKIDKKNLESNLRDIRYEFFEKIRKHQKFDLIAVAHNLDDQAETFLMRMLRGSGLNGLSAMKFKQSKIIRPLLNISRQEILEYLKKEALSYRTDRTNKTNMFLRNKIRNQLIPYLEKKYNPNIKKTIFSSTLSISEDNLFLEDSAKKYHTKSDFLSIKELVSIHPAMQKRVILDFISKKKLDKKNIAASHIEEILKLMQSTKGKNQFILIEGLKILRKGDKVTISKV